LLAPYIGCNVCEVAEIWVNPDFCRWWARLEQAMPDRVRDHGAQERANIAVAS
jgi:hypothetical protein